MEGDGKANKEETNKKKSTGKLLENEEKVLATVRKKFA